MNTAALADWPGGGGRSVVYTIHYTLYTIHCIPYSVYVVYIDCRRRRGSVSVSGPDVHHTDKQGTTLGGDTAPVEGIGGGSRSK